MGRDQKLINYSTTKDMVPYLRGQAEVGAGDNQSARHDQDTTNDQCNAKCLIYFTINGGKRVCSVRNYSP
jgi:hypothetical protein